MIDAFRGEWLKLRKRPAVWILGWILLSLGSFLTRRYQAFGFVIFGAFLMVVFRNPAAKTQAPPATAPSSTWRVPSVLMVR